MAKIHYIFIHIVALFLLWFYDKTLFFIILFFLIIINIFLKNNKNIFLLLTVIIFYISWFFWYYLYPIFFAKNVEDKIGFIIFSDNKFSIISIGLKKYLIFSKNLSVGQKIEISGHISRIINLENYKYYFSSNIYYYFNDYHIKYINNICNNHIHFNYLNYLIFHEYNSSNNIYKFFLINSLSACFIISNIHGYTIKLLFKYIFPKFIINILIILLFTKLLFLENFYIIIFKSLIMEILLLFFSRMDKFLILNLSSIILFLVYGFYLFFSIGFWYSYIINIVVIMINKNKLNKYLKAIIIQLSIFFVVMGFTIFFDNEFNIMLFIQNILIFPFMVLINSLEVILYIFKINIHYNDLMSNINILLKDIFISEPHNILIKSNKAFGLCIIILLVVTVNFISSLKKHSSLFKKNSML